MTKVEKLIWSHLRKKQVLGFKFRRQHPINSYITDFYCHEKRLVIEIDGGIHKQQEQKVYDQHRNKELENLGLKILRIPNEDVENNIDSVIDKIKGALLND